MPRGDSSASERRVAAAFLADLDLAALERRAASLRDCRDNDCLDAALWPSRFRACEVARECFDDGSAFRLAPLPLLTSLTAWRRVLSGVASPSWLPTLARVREFEFLCAV